MYKSLLSPLFYVFYVFMLFVKVKIRSVMLFLFIFPYCYIYNSFPEKDSRSKLFSQSANYNSLPSEPKQQDTLHKPCKLLLK